MRLVALVLCLALFAVSLSAGDSYDFCRTLERVIAGEGCCGKAPALPSIEDGCCETRVFGSLPPAEPRPTFSWVALHAAATATFERPAALRAVIMPIAPPAPHLEPLARGAPERLAHLMRFLN